MQLFEQRLQNSKTIVQNYLLSLLYKVYFLFVLNVFLFRDFMIFML